jgi:hypothetical protein
MNVLALTELMMLRCTGQVQHECEILELLPCFAVGKRGCSSLRAKRYRALDY